jgi:hypothetical protein
MFQSFRWGTPPCSTFTLFFTSLPYPISKSTTVLIRKTTYYIVNSLQKKLYKHVYFILFQSDRFLVVIFVFAGELGVLQWLLSLCLFSLFSQTLCCFTRLKKEKDTSKNVSPFIVENSAASTFPFANSTNPECGLCRVDCDERKPMIQIGFEWDKRSRSYEVINISQSNTTSRSNTIRIKDQALEEKLSSHNCEALTNLTFPDYKFFSFKLITPNLTIFKCNHNLNITSPIFFKNMSCNGNNFYYSHSNNSSPSFNSECSIIQLPVKGLLDYDNLFTFLTAEFDLEVHVSDPCLSCHRRGGRCFNHGEFYCTIAEKGIDYLT